MTNYRRLYVPNATYFFTLITYERWPILTSSQARDCLHKAFEHVRKRWPFTVHAIVLLPNHIHTLWIMPEGDTDYSTRWRLIKSKFTQLYDMEEPILSYISQSRAKKNEHAIWQRRFWEHQIRDERDFEKHFDYIHYNPVKHGYVGSVKDWEFSTFHRYVKEG